MKVGLILQENFVSANITTQELQLSEGETRSYREEGYLLLPGLLDEKTAADLKQEVLDIMKQSANLSHEQLAQTQGKSGKLIQTAQYLRGSKLDELINSDSLRALASQLTGGPSSLYLPFSAVKAGGGGGTFHFHQDNQYTRFDGPGINIWFALSPMTPGNGCLQVVPRSHLSGTLDSVQSPDGDNHRTVANDPTRFLPVRMRPGDAIAFSRLTLHGSGANETNEPRVAYAIQYFRDDVSATWDGETKLLKERPRYTNIAPVEKITPPNARSVDGH
jgi:2-oxoglutarate-dependent dioxygenase